jgi:hypothetical protein
MAPHKLSASGQPTPALSRAKYLAINLFLIFNLIAIICWAVPINTPLTLAARAMFRPYLLSTGLFQAWDMFAPSPKSKNLYLEAIVIYRDGSTEFFAFPRMELLSYTQRYFKERYRKYEEVLASSQFAALWPDAARYIARRYTRSQGHGGAANPPQKIMLVARSSDIIPRTDGGYDRGQWDVNVFYSYDVQPEDLQ